MFNTQQNHPLVERQQNYVLERRLLSVHSIDRDVAKWPFANTFEVELPESLLNVQSMRLAMVNMPAVFYNFNNEYQNTKMFFSIQPRAVAGAGAPASLVDAVASLTDASNAGVQWEITIPNGFYTPCELANEIACLMNDVITRWLRNDPDAVARAFIPSFEPVVQTPITPVVAGYNPPHGYGPVGTTHADALYDSFFVLYDGPALKFVFANDRDPFVLHMGRRSIYDLSQCERPTAFYQWSHWGSGFYLGYDKADYYPVETPSGEHFSFCWKPVGAAPIIEPDVSGMNLADLSGHVYYNQAPHVMKLFGDQLIYMEVDKYNSIDEIYPYTDTTDDLSLCPPPTTTQRFSARDCRANLGGRQVKQQSGHVHSAFAKIPAIATPPAEIYVTPNDFTALSYFSPPLERVQKLKFKFRTHDGRLIDFNDYPFNFTIELNCLRPEPARRMSITVPEVYQLS